jgi:hypothetical protein
LASQGQGVEPRTPQNVMFTNVSAPVDPSFVAP